ncbi:MAG TPA: DsrE family protein [Albidovulum sp.]|uniref:DsrE/DsrF/TusD sulfur relay family protein n=1 Tax=Albidovulum sp. TaxID=1872424 RepID=UPI002BD1B5D8|nr:DsrE family protein [Albidovulum sp.]
MKHLPILDDPPCGTERSYNGLRLAIALPKYDPAALVTVILMADAVVCAKAGQKTPGGFYNLERMPGRVPSAEGRVMLCGTCMDARGLTQDEIIPGAARSTMDELAQATIATGKVLVFGAPVCGP